MTREEAKKRHPGAEPDLLSREVQTLPESTAEHQFNASWRRRGLSYGASRNDALEPKYGVRQGERWRAIQTPRGDVVLVLSA